MKEMKEAMMQNEGQVCEICGICGLRFSIVIILLPALLLLSMNLRAELRAGVARADITPPAGTEMWGYGNRQGTATGVRDLLYARALVLDDGKLAVALVTLDLGRTFGPAQMDAVRGRVRAAGVAQVIFAASHTHSGPVIQDQYADGPPAWEQKALDGIVAAVQEAHRRRAPARVGSAWGVAFIGHDRRYARLDGSVRMLWRNATGLPTYPVDPTVGVLRVDVDDDLGGQPIAVLVNYACHPVVFGPDNLRFSADYPGEMARVMEEAWGGRPMAFFLQGAPGDINPFLDKTPLRENAEEQVRRVGQALGREAVRVSREITTHALPDAALGIAVEPLLFRPRYDAEKLRALLAASGSAQSAARLAAMTRPSYQLPSTTLVLRGAGREWAFVGMPGEPFVNFQLDLRARSPVTHTWFLGYTNGYFGYLPTLREAAAGGYGANGITAWIEVGAGERLLDRGIINLYRLSGRLSDQPEQPR